MLDQTIHKNENKNRKKDKENLLEDGSQRFLA